MTLFTKQDCKPGRNIWLEKLNAEHKTAQLLILRSVTPFFLLWKLRLRDNVKTFFSLPSLLHSLNSFPFFLLSFPPLLFISPPFLFPSIFFPSGYIFKVGEKRDFSGELLQSPSSYMFPQRNRTSKHHWFLPHRVWISNLLFSQKISWALLKHTESVPIRKRSCKSPLCLNYIKILLKVCLLSRAMA